MAIPESVSDLSRRNHTTLLKALASVSQVRVAESSGISETTLSRMKDGELERFCSIAAACNLVLQPRTFRAVDPDRLRALEVLARCALDAPTLQQDE